MNVLRNNIAYLYIMFLIMLLLFTNSCKLFCPEEDDKCSTETLPRIAFLRDRDTTNDATISDSDLWIMDRNGCDQTKLTDGSLDILYFIFSEDGSRICFSAGNNEKSEIFIMNSDGSNLQQLTNTDAPSYPVSFFLDDSKILFNSEIDYYNSDIFTMNIDGTNKFNITDSDSTWESLGDITPDGEKIVYISAHPTEGGLTAIFIIDIDGTNIECITCDIDDRIIALPTSPMVTKDGNEIILISRNRREIGIINIDGDNYGKIYKTQNLDMIWTVLYAPINNYIIFSDSDGQSFTTSYKYDLNNNLLINLKEVYGIESAQSISSDENFLLFTPFPNPITKPHKLYIYDIVNDKKLLLTEWGDRYPKFQPY